MLIRNTVTPESIHMLRHDPSHMLRPDLDHTLSCDLGHKLRSNPEHMLNTDCGHKLTTTLTLMLILYSDDMLSSNTGRTLMVVIEITDAGHRLVPETGQLLYLSVAMYWPWHSESCPSDFWGLITFICWAFTLVVQWSLSLSKYWTWSHTASWHQLLYEPWKCSNAEHGTQSISVLDHTLSTYPSNAMKTVSDHTVSHDPNYLLNTIPGHICSPNPGRMLSPQSCQVLSSDHGHILSSNLATHRFLTHSAENWLLSHDVPCPQLLTLLSSVVTCWTQIHPIYDSRHVLILKTGQTLTQPWNTRLSIYLSIYLSNVYICIYAYLY